MRPLESFSTFCAQGITKCFTGLATGGRNVCSRRVIGVCAVAVKGANNSADAADAKRDGQDTVHGILPVFLLPTGPQYLQVGGQSAMNRHVAAAKPRASREASRLPEDTYTGVAER